MWEQRLRMAEAHLPKVFPVFPILHVEEIGAGASLPASGSRSGAAVAPAAGSASPVGTWAALPAPAHTEDHLDCLTFCKSY